ncbi:UDP-N-acetylglucosamine transporter UGNT1-like [Typha angustifolia]|uniref:UDP-N-acetylglucosamine transporter UGNT1-like n=1 Tax=Typha angustifolia TaxID=59011 RepID=UPI003C2E8927
MASKMSPLIPVSNPSSNGGGGGGGRQGGAGESSAMSREGAYAAIAYMACAVLLVMVNKAALSSYDFPSANVITLYQMIASTSICYALKRWKAISFKTDEAETESDDPIILVPPRKLLQTLPLSLTYLIFMLTSMYSIRGVSVPMYTTLRRTTVVFTMIAEYLLKGQAYTPSIFTSAGLIVLGAFIAGARDLSYEPYSYAIVLGANIATAVYLATLDLLGKSSGLTSFGHMWCNGLVCAPLLLCWTFISGDLESIMSFPDLYSPGFQVVLLLSCIVAFLLNYTIFLNTTLNSAVTQTMCGNMKVRLHSFYPFPVCCNGDKLL